MKLFFAIGAYILIGILCGYLIQVFDIWIDPISDNDQSKGFGLVFTIVWPVGLVAMLLIGFFWLILEGTNRLAHATTDYIRKRRSRRQ